MNEKSGIKTDDTMAMFARRDWENAKKLIGEQEDEIIYLNEEIEEQNEKFKVERKKRRVSSAKSFVFGLAVMAFAIGSFNVGRVRVAANDIRNDMSEVFEHVEIIPDSNAPSVEGVSYDPEYMIVINGNPVNYYGGCEIIRNKAKNLGFSDTELYMAIQCEHNDKQLSKDVAGRTPSKYELEELVDSVLEEQKEEFIEGIKKHG